MSLNVLLSEEFLQDRYVWASISTPRLLSIPDPVKYLRFLLDVCVSFCYQHYHRLQYVLFLVLAHSETYTGCLGRIHRRICLGLATISPVIFRATCCVDELCPPVGGVELEAAFFQNYFVAMFETFHFK